MKIAIVGCGAVGSYYGALIARSGHDVHFLLRSDFETVQRDGVSILSPEGNFIARPHCATSSDAIGICELVIIGLKTTANEQFPRLLPPLIGTQTAVLTLQNGLGNEEHLSRILPAEQILGGLCFVCLNRIAPGVIRHIAQGMVVIGEYQRPPQARTEEIASLFRTAGVPCKAVNDIMQAHWEKLVWNIPFNGLGVAGVLGYDALTANLPPSHGTRIEPVLTTDILLADARWEKLVRELMAEVIATAGALGFNISDGYAEKQIERTRAMGAYKASTLIDFERGSPLEVESLFLMPLREAQRLGVPTPRLKALCAALERLNPAA